MTTLNIQQQCKNNYFLYIQNEIINFADSPLLSSVFSARIVKLYTYDKVIKYEIKNLLKPAAIYFLYIFKINTAWISNDCQMCR